MATKACDGITFGYTIVSDAVVCYRYPIGKKNLVGIKFRESRESREMSPHEN